MARVRAIVAASALGLALLLAGTRAGAQTRDLRWNPTLDVPIALVAGAAFLLTEAFKPELAPSICRWCAVNAADTSVRNGLVWPNTSAANVASNVIAVLAPVVAAGVDVLAASHDGSSRGVPIDALLIAEATLLAGDANQLTKLLTGRERPFVHALSDDRKRETANPSNNNLSFFSGHAAETFALATATGTVATLRGYRWAPVAWIVGGALAAATGYLRIAADQHWLTDVLVGMVVGAGIGFAVPYLFHRPATE
jgi:membrane-associated phospholipid phosphatase